MGPVQVEAGPKAGEEGRECGGVLRGPERKGNEASEAMAMASVPSLALAADSSDPSLMVFNARALLGIETVSDECACVWGVDGLLNTIRS
jgi:hypothetical protein